MGYRMKPVVSPYGRVYLVSSAPHDLGPAIGPIVGISVTALLYVPYTYIFVKLIRYRQSRNLKSLPLTLSLISLFTVTSVEFLCNLIAVVDAFAIHSYDGTAYYYRADNFAFTTQRLCMYIGHVIVTSLLIWRLYLVWNRNIYVIIPPVVTELLVIGSGFALVTLQVLSRHRPELATPYFNTMSTYMCVVTWQYLITTILIVAKIWTAQRRIDMPTATTARLVRNFIWLNIENGGLASLYFALFAVLQFTGYHGLCPLFAGVYVLFLGIIPMWIIYEMHIASSREEDDVKPPTFHVTFRPAKFENGSDARDSTDIEDPSKRRRPLPRPTIYIDVTPDDNIGPPGLDGNGRTYERPITVVEIENTERSDDHGEDMGGINTEKV